MSHNKYTEGTPPAKYADCSGYMNPPGACKILKEMICAAKGKCKFYAPKGGGTDAKPN